jgi:hypothetical protein
MRRTTAMQYKSLLKEESGNKSQKLYFKTDIEIAQETPMDPLAELAGSTRTGYGVLSYHKFSNRYP